MWMSPCNGSCMSIAGSIPPFPVSVLLCLADKSAWSQWSGSVGPSGATLSKDFACHLACVAVACILVWSWIAGFNRGGGQSRRNRNSHPQTTITSSFIDPFNSLHFGMPGINDLFSMGQTGPDAFTSFSSLSNFSGPSGGAVKRTSTSTRFINGKKTTTKK